MCWPIKIEICASLWRMRPRYAVREPEASSYFSVMAGPSGRRPRGQLMSEKSTVWDWPHGYARQRHKRSAHAVKASPHCGGFPKLGPRPALSAELVAHTLGIPFSCPLVDRSGPIAQQRRPVIHKGQRKQVLETRTVRPKHNGSASHSCVASLVLVHEVAGRQY